MTTMFDFNAADFELMGQIVTFDVVTFCGLICIAIVYTGLATAKIIEQSKHSKVRIKEESVSHRRKPRNE